MARRPLPWWSSLLVLSLSSLPGAALAQTPGPKPNGAAAPTPPKLRKAVEAPYPASKAGSGENATVRLDLSIDATGTVAQARVRESGGEAFDEAALEAAKQLQFEPAQLDGKPIAAKIVYRFDFAEAPKAPVPPDPATSPAPTEGTQATPATPAASAPASVLNSEIRASNDVPVAGAVVTVTLPDGTTRTSTTDATGKCTFDKLPAGAYTVLVEASGFEPYTTKEEIGPNTGLNAIYRLSVPRDGDSDITVRGVRPPREVTKVVLEQREINRIPGTGGDALKAIQNLPGLARSPGFSGALLVRGSAPMDTRIFVDGTEIPLAYHFGGLSSVVPTELLQNISFYPGNFSPEYGRAKGGIVDIGVRSPKKKWSGLLQVDLIDARTVVEGPIDDKTRFAVAARRSWVDAWLGPLLTAMGTGVGTAPVYYDYQAMIERDVSSTTKARLLFLGADDRLAITLNSPSSSDPAAGGDISSFTSFWRLQARTETAFSSNVRWVNTLAAGENKIGFALGDIFFKLNTVQLSARSDLRVRLSKEASFVVGLDWLYTPFNTQLRAPPPPIPGQASGPFFGRPVREQSGSGDLYRPGLYTMLELNPIRGLKLLPGVRVDYTRDTSSWDVSPRFAARYDITREGAPRTTLKGGAGIFLQPPMPQQSIPPFGSPNMRNERATHYSIGFEQEIPLKVKGLDLDTTIDLSVEGFFRDTALLVSQNAAETTQGSGVLYGNNGSGRAYGLEVLLRYKPDKHFFGWVAYTLSRSEVRNSPQEPFRSFQFDQTHILTVVASYRLGLGWEIGARFRYTSGNMYTPRIGSTQDYDAGAYAPITAYPPFGSRLPDFHMLDIRIDKTFDFKTWKLGVYLDIYNIYNRQNPEGVSYNYNYTQSSTIAGLPILPTLGLRGEL